MRTFFGFDEQFSERKVRNMIAAYLGAVTHLDRQIGRVLDQLNSLGMTDDTRIIYTSDHGEHAGARGIFGKFTMYEESAAVPFIMAGPDVPLGKVCHTPISLVDSFPTIVESVGAELAKEENDLPGQSLWQIARQPDQERFVFSEYHAVGTQHGYFMLTDGQHKYVHYIEGEPQLFNLDDDPQELTNLASAEPSTVARFETELRKLIDPEQVDAQAKASQAAKIEAFGGEEKVLARGFFVNSPTPDEEPKFLGL
jgi:choline-sulfatase